MDFFVHTPLLCVALTTSDVITKLVDSSINYMLSKKQLKERGMSGNRVREMELANKETKKKLDHDTNK